MGGSYYDADTYRTPASQQFSTKRSNDSRVECDHCGTLNNHDVTRCVSCGAAFTKHWTLKSLLERIVE